MSPLARAGHLLESLRQHWEYEVQRKIEVIRKNVEFLTSKPRAGHERDSEHSHQTAVRSEPVAFLSTSEEHPASPSVTSRIVAPAPDHLKRQMMQLLSSPALFTDESRERLLQELSAFLKSSSSIVFEPGASHPSASCAAGQGQNVKLTASSAAAKARSMPLPPELELPVHSDAATHSSFEIGLLSEHSILELEGEVRRGERPDLVTGDVSSPSTGGEIPELIPCIAPAPSPVLDDVRKFLIATGKVLAVVKRFGLPESSMENKLPWHVPPPPFLAKGLEWPPDHFASDQERIEFNRRARKRKKYLLGPLPTSTFMLANIALIAVLVQNPTAR